MPARARSSSVTRRAARTSARLDRRRVASRPARSMNVSMIGRNRASKNASANCEVRGQVGRERRVLAVGAGEPSDQPDPVERPSGEGSCRGRRGARTGADCPRTAAVDPAADRPSGGRAPSSSPRVGQLRGATQKQSWPRYRRGTRPHCPTDRKTSRPASWSSSASWTPVCPDPTSRTPPGGSCAAFAVVVRVDLGDPRREPGRGCRDLRRLEGAGGDDHLVGVERTG